METLVEHACGLDVHQATVVACLLAVRKDGKAQKQLRTFGTTMRELLNLRQWLVSEGCTHVAMESTGVYWKPTYAILGRGELEIIVANAQQVKKVPGRKTDVKDAEWLAELLRHGLLRSSFIPPAPIRELRDLTRYRRKLVEVRSAERNRLLNSGWTESVLYNFTGGSDGGVPGSTLLLGPSGVPYGTTEAGGIQFDLGTGTVFQLMPSGGGWSLSTLEAFVGPGTGGPNGGVKRTHWAISSGQIRPPLTTEAARTCWASSTNFRRPAVVGCTTSYMAFLWVLTAIMACIQSARWFSITLVHSTRTAAGGNYGAGIVWAYPHQ